VAYHSAAEGGTRYSARETTTMTHKLVVIFGVGDFAQVAQVYLSGTGRTRWPASL
jgi:hypothetical protein